MSYQQGLSGLSAASNDLDVIGNNIANANTTGFKSSTAEFADMYANSIATAVNNQIGIGVRLAGVAQDFSQGQITTTDQALDVAINGSGFFQMSDGAGGVTYSRDGEFHKDNNGFIVDPEGNQLMGYAAGANGVINTAQTVPLKIPNTNLAPVATTSITAGLNLDAQQDAPKDATFDPTDPDSYSYSTSVQSFDSLGAEHDVNLYFVKSATSGQWEVYAGTAGTTPTDMGSVSFDTSGKLVGSAAPDGTATTEPGQFTLNLTNTDGAADQSINFDMSSTTQFGGSNGVNNLTQDGFAAAELSNYSVGPDGTLTVNYSDGRTSVIGQVVLANFNNPNGLQDLGNNQYAATAASGVAQISAPDTTGHGSLQGSALEESNVDLTSSLVDLITAQRNYQANAQTIKTQQTIDQTLINL